MPDPAFDRLASLPITDPAYFDCLSGAVIRLFVRLERLDGELRSLAPKVARRRVKTDRAPPPTQQPAKPGGVDVFGAPVYPPKQRRARGRPAGARDTYQRVRSRKKGNGLDPDHGA